MKVNFFVQTNGQQVNQEDLVNAAKKTWQDQGNKVKDIENLDLYFNANEGKCYFVINGTENGSI